MHMRTEENVYSICKAFERAVGFWAPTWPGLPCFMIPRFCCTVAYFGMEVYVYCESG